MQLLELDASTYIRSALHGADRVWPETNCYVDLWIEVLHSLGHDPRAGLAFTLSADFEGEQWQFVKYPLEDLRELYGLDVAELNPWQGLEHHIIEQLAQGRLMTAEVDSWFLPDTAGVSYRTEHVKSSIVVNKIDRDARELGYFHGASYYELGGEDYDGVLRRTEMSGDVLPPYTERIRDVSSRERSSAAIDHVMLVSAKHFARRPDGNPVEKLAARFRNDLEWLRAGGVEAFHQYAFATLRQCGATAELAVSLLEFCNEHSVETGGASKEFSRVAELAKTMQFKLARLAAGRAVDLDPLFEEMAQRWSMAFDELLPVLG